MTDNTDNKGPQTVQSSQGSETARTVQGSQASETARTVQSPLRTYADVTKFGIVVFSLITGIAGYVLGFSIDAPFYLSHFLQTVLGLYFLASGMLALNQVQEWKSDAKMPRTQGRPIPSGRLKPLTVGVMSLMFIFCGIHILLDISIGAGLWGLLSVVLYNGCYTLWWKPKWTFGAVPGAIPGALPVVIGYAASHSSVLTVECVYIFLLMFLWQMPHFWAIALKIKDQYKNADFPVLPVVLGEERTVYYIGLYLFPYIGLAVAAPWFVKAQWVYLGLVIPFCIKLLIEFYRFVKWKQKNWLSFFMWTNVSLLVFLFAPILDKWVLLF